MKTFILLFAIIFSSYPLQAQSRNCQLECPVQFGDTDSSDPLRGYRERQSCLSACEQANAQQYEIQKQTREMEEQTELMEERLQEEEDLQHQLEEQQELLESQQDRIEELESEQLFDE